MDAQHLKSIGSISSIPSQGALPQSGPPITPTILDYATVWNTLYIDDLRIDDQSSMLASSFLSKSTIEIDDPTVSRPDF